MATWVFSKLQGLQYYFPENFRCNLKFYKKEIFSDSFFNRISIPKIFAFSAKNCLTWGVKREKLNFRGL